MIIPQTGLGIVCYTSKSCSVGVRWRAGEWAEGRRFCGILNRKIPVAARNSRCLDGTAECCQPGFPAYVPAVAWITSEPGIAQALLQARGMTVVVADDGQEGCKVFEKSAWHYFDCILMDIRMPVMNGYQAARAIRAMNREDARTVPIIAMTADAFEDDIQKCLEAGMNTHIAKPVEPVRLYQLISRYTAGKDSR